MAIYTADDINVVVIVRNSPLHAITLKELERNLVEVFAYREGEAREAIDKSIIHGYISVGDAGGELEPTASLQWCNHDTIQECHEYGCLLRNPAPMPY